MPFGLMNAPSTFQRLMDQLFRGLRFMRVYLDELVVLLKSLDEHLAHLTQVFCISRDNGLKLNIAKCGFAQSQTRLLGHIVSAQGIRVDTEIIRTIQQQLARPILRSCVAFLVLPAITAAIYPGLRRYLQHYMLRRP